MWGDQHLFNGIGGISPHVIQINREWLEEQRNLLWESKKLVNRWLLYVLFTNMVSPTNSNLRNEPRASMFGP
jgi:hypothetical protein